MPGTARRWGSGAGALHGYEAADDERLVAAQGAVVAGETDGPGVLVQAQWCDEAPALGEGMDPGQIPGVDGDDDGVEAGVRDDLGRKVFGVGGDHTDAVVSRACQEVGCAFGDGRIDIDRGDAALVADEFSEEGSVVATGADLQNLVSGLDAGRFEHVGLQPGRGDRAGDAASAVVAGGDDVVGVRLLGGHGGGEDVPGHGAEGVLDGGGADVSGGGEPVGQLVAQGACLIEFGGGRRHGGPFGRSGHARSATVDEAGFGMLALGAYWAACAVNMAE